MEGLSQNEKKIWICWDAKTPREVVREAATKGNLIKLAHKYLMHKNAWDEQKTADWFQSEVFIWVIQLLERKQIYKARHTLEKTQLVPEEHFLKIAREAKEIKFRDYVVEQLKLCSDKLDPEEWKNFLIHWNLLRYLEISFEVDGTFKQNKAFGQGRNIIVVTESEIKDMNVDMIVNYPDEWKSKIAAHLFFDTFEFSLLEFLSPAALWNYLLEQNKSMILVRWINMHMSEVVRDMNARYNFFTNENFVDRLQKVDTKGLTTEILEKLDDYFRKWPIDSDMIDSVATKHCFAYTKMCVYDTLSSYGIILEDEKNNLQTILSRLARTRNLKMIDLIFSESCATISKSDFYKELAKYCLKNKLYNAFTCCVDCTVIQQPLTDVEEDIKGCIELWLLFKSIEQTSDRQSHVLPIYKTCEQIARDNIGEYICKNPYLVLGMILLDENKSLFDIFTEDNILKFNDFELPLKCSFDDKLSHLKNVWNSYKNSSVGVENDVNMYQLMGGYRGLDISKVFEFQLINHKPVSGPLHKTERRSFGSLVSNEFTGGTIVTNKPIGMPHFANESLMKKYGYVAKLNHIYYLKQCRPCSASRAFVTYHYQRYNRLHDKGIQSGCSEAHALALRSWNDPTMSASAASFIAMIGCNPTRCRIHISAAKIIKEHLVYFDKKTQEAAVAIVNDMLLKLSQNDKNSALDMLRYLETITMHNINSHKDAKDSTMSFIIYEWQTAIKFAMLHNLPLPECQLREFVKSDQWFPFLMFGDIFRYPQQQMLELSRDFKCRSYSEHLKHIIIHRSLDDFSLTEKETTKSGKDLREKRVSRVSSADTSPTHNASFDFPDVVSSCDDLWEILTLCHTQEDPPSALLNAASHMRVPLLALVATCYEPGAAGIGWAYWLLSILGDAVPVAERDGMTLDVSDKHPREEDIFRLCHTCIEAGYVRTLHESMLIFFPESPLTNFTAFLCKTVWQLSFEPETTKLIYTFTQCCQRKMSTPNVENISVPSFTKRQCLQKISVHLVQLVLEKAFASAHHQKEFLRCLVESQFGKDFIVPTPEYHMLNSLAEISMESELALDMKQILNDSTREDYLTQCIQTLISNSQYELALKFAKTSRLPADDIVTAKWLCKWQEMVDNSDDIIDDASRTLYLAKCSESFKMAAVSFETASIFILKHIDEMKDSTQKFYSYRIVLSWFQDHNIFDSKREDIEHLMWESYFNIESIDEVFLDSYAITIHFVLNKQKEIDHHCFDEETESRFDKLLAEIEIQSDAENITTTKELSDINVIEKWRKVLSILLEKNLIVEAFRLSNLYKVSEDCFVRSTCPCLLVKTCMQLAEGFLSPYDISKDFKIVISSPLVRSRMSGSETSVASFEELVIISDKADESGDASQSTPVPSGKDFAKPTAQLAGREDADRLSALECLSSRGGIGVAKQVASYYRISLQIGWSYVQLLKFRGNPLEFISYLSGRARMALASLVFRTYNVSSKQIADFLCLELVTAIISPHLIKTSTFRQKEHFQYTLWGYPLNSDIEMFLNLRPDACSLIGRAILDHLMAFGRIYRSNVSSKQEIDENSLDVETLLDEEYQTVEHSEVDTITTKTGESIQTASTLETDSIYSEATTVYSYSTKLTRESRRNLFDVISKCNVHIPYEVKSNVRQITRGTKLSSKQVNIISIELLVIAHDAFSSACDTEGIAVVLRSAQALTTRLLQAKSWRLLARLLTGLARYTEMAYVFQMLMDNDQFEFLLGQVDYMLGQQVDKIAEFKQGMLDYLKTHRPADRETYCMVAHHFNMYCEAADVKKKQAEDLIGSLAKMATNDGQELPNNNTATLLLDTTIQHYTDASEWYLRGGALGAARAAAGGAMRAALQIALLQRATQVGSQTPRAPYLFAASTCSSTLFAKLGVLEGVILCQALEGHMCSWRELAFGRLQNNDLEYARSLASQRPDLALTLLQRLEEQDKKDFVENAAFKELNLLCK